MVRERNAQPPAFRIIRNQKMRETEMQLLALIGVILFSAVASTATLAAPSQEQCNTLWLTADKDTDGDLTGAELTRYLIAIIKDGRHLNAIKDGKLDVDEFMAACKDGVFESMEEKHR